MNKELFEFIKDNENNIIYRWKEQMKENNESRLKVAKDNVLFHASKDFVDIVLLRFTSNDEDYEDHLNEFSERIVQLNWPLSTVTSGLFTLSKVVLDVLSDNENIGAEENLQLFRQFDSWMTPMCNEIIDSYTETWERTISLQKIALQELSASLIPVFDKISVMPLVGTIDTERAKLIMENLLTGVVKNRAEVVLIDITGVPVVDTMVAHYIIQAADAVRLVGANCMIVGIRPEIAQTIVNLGIDLSQLTTHSTLLKGIEKALEFTDRKIVALEDES